MPRQADIDIRDHDVAVDADHLDVIDPDHTRPVRIEDLLVEYILGQPNVGLLEFVGGGLVQRSPKWDGCRKQHGQFGKGNGPIAGLRPGDDGGNHGMLHTCQGPCDQILSACQCAGHPRR